MKDKKNKKEINLNDLTYDSHGAVKMEKMRYHPIRPHAKNRIKVQDCTFRDGHQSLFATRTRTDSLVSIAKEMDKIGFYSIEVWGGATFDVMHRYLAEDPWERIRTLKKYITKTPFSMLLRGQNLVGYRNYADDVVEAFVQTSCDNGIDIFRVFDALNDFRNFITAVEVIKKNKKHFQGTICYSLTEMRMGGDLYNIEYYINKAKELVKLGADSICIKDMAGIIAPYDGYNLIKTLKSFVKIPINLHTHFTSGMGDLTLLKAIEAGVDIIDTCMAPFAYRSSHAAIEPLVVTLLGTNRDTGFDINALNEIDKKIEELVPRYKHFADTTKYSIIDPNVIIHQTPGGMLSNLVDQLRSMGELDKLPKVFKLLPKVRKDLGQVPLVTPTSQIVGIQTVNNVLFDKMPGQYNKITEQVKDLCYGLYGQTPRPTNARVCSKALKGYIRGSEPITIRPADILEPEMPAVKEKVKGLAKSLEDELIVALYPVTGARYLRWKYGKEEIPAEVKARTYNEIQKDQELIQESIKNFPVEKLDKEIPIRPSDIHAFDVFVDGEYFRVEVGDQGVPKIASSAQQHSPVHHAHPAVHHKPAAPGLKPESDPSPAPRPAQPKASHAKSSVAAAAGAGEFAVSAPMPGMLVKYEVALGAKVKQGDLLCVLEAMKMFNNITAPQAGEVKSMPFSPGDAVSKGDSLITLKV